MATRKKIKKRTSKVAEKKHSTLPNLPGLILFVIAFLLYSNTLTHEYAFDDYSVIKENFVVKQGFEGISTILTTNYRYGYWNSPGTLYRPTSLVMFAIEWGIAPDTPALSHFINILLFALTGFLLVKVLFNMAGLNNLHWVFISSLIFVAHPIHTEVVANIKSRDELLAFFFFLLALGQVFTYLKKDKVLPLILGLLWFTLAMFSKESSITYWILFPAAIYFFKKEASLNKVALIAGLFLLPIGIYLQARYAVLGSIGGLGGKVSMLDNILSGVGSAAAQTATAFSILGLYLYKLFIPSPLVSDMGFSEIQVIGWNNIKAICSLLVYLAIGAGTIYGIFKKHPLAFAGLFFLATLSIFSNLILLIGSSYGERFLYTPSLGFTLALAWALIYFFPPQSIKKKDKLRAFWSKGKIVLGISFGLALIYGMMTIIRNPDWKNSYTIYQSDVSKSPNCAKVHYHLGLELVKLGLKADQEQKQKYLTDAVNSFQRAIDIYPKYGDAYAQLGLAAFRANDNEKALEFYEQSLEYKPNNATVYNNMGIIFFQKGDLERAMEVYKKAVELDPRYVDALRNLGSTYAMQKQFDQAIEQFRKALQFSPNDATINFYLGSAYKDIGDETNARPYLDKAYRLDPGLPRK